MNISLEGALERCRDQFQEYRDYHISKMTPDSLRKAATNQQMIDMINDALKANQVKAA